MCIEIYDGLKFGQMTVIGLNIKETKRIKNKAKVYDLLCSCEKTKTMRDNHIKRAIVQGKNTTCDLCYTFDDWCKDNKHQEFLDLWDYELNDKKPSEVSSVNGKKFYFKCQRQIHASQIKRIADITYGKQSVSCSKCNSFGQYLLDTYGNLDMWSENNIVDPFTIGKCRNKKDGYVLLICQDCKREKMVCCNDFVYSNSIGCSCGSGQSYPNKFVTCFLRQLSLDFINEKYFGWSTYDNCRNRKLNGRKIYDNYIDMLGGIIIENHGIQHYERSFSKYGGRSLKEEQENDKLKRELALNNGIKHYIELDCRKSELEWIKNSIMSSELPVLLNFKEEDINWLECEKFALKNLVKEACFLWENGTRSTIEIGKIMNISFNTISSYLKKGKEVGWCDYDASTVRHSTKLNTTKKILVYKDGVFLGKFNSSKELSLKSMDIFNIKFDRKSITQVCGGSYPYNTYKGYTFKYP